MSLKFGSLLSLASSAFSQTVTIRKDIPASGHRCIRDCLFRPYNARTDLGDVLECAPPYEEDCYCPKNDDLAERVERHIDDCAKENCSAGDVSGDVESMKELYGTYCHNNGYTRDIVEEWYSSFAVGDTMTTSEETRTASTSKTESKDEPTATGQSDRDDNPDGLPGFRDDDGEEPTSKDSNDDDTPERKDNPDGLPSMDDAARKVPAVLLYGLLPLLAILQLV